MITETDQEVGNMVFNYNNVFFSLFIDNDRMCVHRCSNFGLNLTLTMYKQPFEGQRYQRL